MKIITFNYKEHTNRRELLVLAEDTTTMSGIDLSLLGVDSRQEMIEMKKTIILKLKDKKLSVDVLKESEPSEEIQKLLAPLSILIDTNKTAFRRFFQQKMTEIKEVV